MLRAAVFCLHMSTFVLCVFFSVSTSAASETVTHVKGGSGCVLHAASSQRNICSMISDSDSTTIVRSSWSYNSFLLQLPSWIMKCGLEVRIVTQLVQK